MSTAEACSYNPSNRNQPAQKIFCDTKGSEQMSLLLKNEKQELDKADKQLQELKEQIKVCKK